MFIYNFKSIIFYTQINFIYKCYVNILEDIIFIKKHHPLIDTQQFVDNKRLIINILEKT